jgi:hypothetical protein
MTMHLPHTERRVYLGPVPGAPPLAMASERDEPVVQTSVDSSMAPFVQPLTWYEWRELRRLPLAIAESYIPIVEQRLERNHELLDVLPRQLEDVQHQIEADEAALGNAWAAISQLMIDDTRRTGGLTAPGLIINQHVTIDPGIHVVTRHCTLRETAEWGRLEYTKMRLEPAASERRKRRGELEKALKDEHNNTTLLQSRLHHLREHVEWWRRHGQ